MHLDVRLDKAITCFVRRRVADVVAVHLVEVEGALFGLRREKGAARAGEVDCGVSEFPARARG